MNVLFWDQRDDDNDMGFKRVIVPIMMDLPCSNVLKLFPFIDSADC